MPSSTKRARSYSFDDMSSKDKKDKKDKKAKKTNQVAVPDTQNELEKLRAENDALRADLKDVRSRLFRILERIDDETEDEETIDLEDTDMSDDDDF